MRSVRLDPELDEQVRRAAAAEGTSVSDFIREAVAERARQSLRHNASDRLADVIGAVHGGGKHARRSGEAFTEALANKRRAT